MKALATTFAHDDGVAVLHETIQYLLERPADEEPWLRSLTAHDPSYDRANHYLQCDRPDAFVQTVLHALDSPDDAAPGALSEASKPPCLSTVRAASCPMRRN